MTAPAERDRVYMPTGKMAHLLPPGDSPTFGYAFSLCRMQPRLFTSWLGTGSQSEYEKAASLPLCGRCSGAATEADRPFAETASPQNTPAGAPRPGRGLNAASEPSRPAPAAAVPGAAHPSPGGTWDGLDRAGAADHPSAVPARKPAEDRPPVSVEGGLEGLPPALARAREAAFDRGDPGSSSRGATCEGNAAAGNGLPAAAQTSSPLLRGCGEAKRGPDVPCGPDAGFPPESSSPALQGHAGEANNSAGSARSNAALPAVSPGLSGQAFRDAVRAAQVAAARTRRTGRGKRAAKADGSRYVPGANRRQPPDGAS